jgi:hypothetical protein
MLFRIWYHTGNLGLLGLALTAAGTMFNRTSFLLPVGIAIIAPLGIVGAILGIIWCTLGLRSACPRCGAPADWVSPAKSIIAVDCEHCGLVGGNPMWNLVPRTLNEFYEDDEDDEDEEPAS